MMATEMPMGRRKTSKRLFGIRRISGRGLALWAAGVAMFWVTPAPGQPAPSAASPPPQEVRLGYFANVTHAQAVLGVASGDFERAVAPARLTPHIFSAGPALVEALFAGEIDVGYMGPSPALNAHIQSRGKGIRIVCGAAANGVVIVARAGSGIGKLEDLKGRRIATPQLGNTQDISARHYLTKVLGQQNTENIVPIPNAEQAAMMSRGEIDAAWAVEPWGSRLVADAGATVVGEERDLWPDQRFILTLVVVSPDFLQKHPETVEALLRVHCDWTKRLSEDGPKHAEELAVALARLTNQKMPASVIESSLRRVTFTEDPLVDSIRTYAQWAQELGVARSVPNISALVDTRLLEKVRADGASGRAGGRDAAPPAAPAKPKPQEPR
jgi:NitT/TauT family transport system substrate-binding protein